MSMNISDASGKKINNVFDLNAKEENIKNDENLVTSKVQSALSQSASENKHYLNNKNNISPSNLTHKRVNSLDSKFKDNLINKLNIKISDFRDSVEQINGSNDLSDQVAYSQVLFLLKQIAHDYYLCQQHGFWTSSNKENEILSIFSSTFLEKENDQLKSDISVNFPSYSDSTSLPLPHVPLTMYNLWEFLKKEHFSKSTNESDRQFSKLVIDCIKLYLLAKISDLYFNDDAKIEGLCKFVIQKHIYNLIKDLPIGGLLVLPGGWLNCPQLNLEGHFMLYVLERNENESFLISRISTHSNCIVEKEIQSSQKVQFISDLTSLFFRNYLHKNITIDDLLSKCMVNHRPKLPHLKIFNKQENSNNCVFISFFYLYNFLMTKNNETLQGTDLRINLFRKEFRDFLIENSKLRKIRI